MPDFAYKARDERGELIKGVLAAQDEDHLADLLEADGLHLVASAKARRRVRRAWLQPRIRRRDLVLFSIHVGTALSGGISLLEALRTYADESAHDRLRTVAREMAYVILGGTSFSDALAGHPDVFPPVYVSMVRAGEATGRVDSILHDLVGFLEWQEALAGTIRQALAYPILVFTAILGLVALLLGFVFPQVIPVLQKAGVDLPLPTRVLIVVSTAVRQYWIPGLAVLGVVVAGLVLYVRTPAGRLQFDRFVLRVPVVGGVVRRIALSRFSRNLAVLYQAGVDFIQSLSVVERVVQNRIIEEAIRNAREEVLSGSLLSAALKRSAVVPSLVVQMVAMGETTGELEDSLRKVSQYYDREVQESVRRAAAYLEPAMIATAAGMVLFVALSILLPLWGMIGQLARR